MCWEPDGSTECTEGTSTRTCLQYNGGDCDEVEVSEMPGTACFWLDEQRGQPPMWDNFAASLALPT